MTASLLGVVSSLVASLLLVAAGWFGSQPVRRWLIFLLSRLTGVGLLRTYPTQTQANADLADDLKRARWVKVLTGRGNELTRDSFQVVWRNLGDRLESAQVLLPNPDITAPTRSWLDQREDETRQHDTGFRQGVLRDQVRANLNYLQAVAQQSANLQIRLYNQPQVARVIITDRLAYITIYSPFRHGRHSPCLVCGTDSPLYDLAARMFSTTWISVDPA